MVEGRTEQAFLQPLRDFLRNKLEQMPRLVVHRYDGRLPKEASLRRTVHNLLHDGERSVDHVIALTDVYTGTNDFTDATDAKAKMRTWVGPEPRFHAHAALHDFEAWLIPYWNEITRLAQSNRVLPSRLPENINHNRPPSRVIAEVFETGQSPRSYSKTRDAARILKGQDLAVAAEVCPELKAFLNTILRLCGGTEI